MVPPTDEKETVEMTKKNFNEFKIQNPLFVCTNCLILAIFYPSRVNCTL